MGIQALLEENDRKDLLRFLTAGSVDDGKSTLIGRLLYDSKLVYEDHLQALEKDSARVGHAGDGIDYSLLLDGLKAEREQGITIDVAYRYFSTPRRKFIIADTPGHEQYTRNMATGASTADLAILLVDARHGVVDQTRRHAFIVSLLGIQHVVVCVNKMDLVDFSRQTFEEIQRDFADFGTRLEIRDVHFVPISALEGDNVVTRSERTPWFQGAPLLHHLENVHIAADRNLIDLRFPVQYVLRQSGDFRGYCGTLASGVIRPGDEVLALPSGRRSRVRSVATWDGEREEAFPPMAVTVSLEDEIDVSRGDVLVHPGNVPARSRDLDAFVVWMAEEPARVGGQYWIKHGHNLVRAELAAIRYRTDVNTLRREEASSLALNEIGRVRLVTARPLLVDPYGRNRSRGAFVVIDTRTNVTVGAGMVLDRRTEEQRARDRGPRSAHVSRHRSRITPEARAERLGQKGCTLWLTGLPRAGKSSIAYALEERLFERGHHARVVDGENLRLGLSADLGFSAADRTENIRRAAHVAALASDLGVITLVALVSPYELDRARARDVIGPERFREVHVTAPLEICEERDQDGLYARAHSGEIEQFSGISAPYEAPETPDLRLETDCRALDDCVDALMELLERDGFLES